MRAEAVLLVRDRLAHGTEGVNALLASVPLEGGWSVPPAVQVVDAVTYPWVARGQFDRKKVAAGPWLLVTVGGDIAGTARPDEQGPRPTVDVVVRYACAGTDARTLADLARFESVTMRAALRAVLAPWNDAADEVQERNGVEFEAPAWRWLDPLDPPGDDVLSSALVLSFGIIDPWALGTI